MRHETRMQFMRMAVILAMFGYTAATLAASGSFEENIAVGDGVIVDVTNLNGDVVVRGANVDEVTVRARISIDKRFERTDPQKAGKVIGEIRRSPPIELIGNRVVIGELTKHTHQRYASLSYEILVPSDATVSIHTESGDVRVSGVTGPVNATSDKGDVTVA